MDIDNNYGTLDIQQKLLVLLKNFHQFCVANDIKYSLDWGSLLGAIRHKGFIPWDDDLDIMVDRENFEKINRLIEISDNLAYEHGTIESLWINRVRLDSESLSNPKPTMDVFVIDNAPNGCLARKSRVVLIRAMQGMMKNKPNYMKGNILYRIATLITYLLGKSFSHDTLIKWYNKISQLSNKKQTQMKACYNADFNDVAKLRHSDVIGEYVLVPFEDCEVFVTKGYHQALVDMFGPDYMTPVFREPIHI